MLTLYRPRRSEDSEESDGRKVIPAGRPYLTRINGQLVMARERKDKPSSVAIDLLGEAFGVRTRVIRKRAKSLDGPKLPVMIARSPYCSQQLFNCTTPTFPQQVLPPVMIQAQQIQQPLHFTVAQSKPTQKDFEQLKSIDAHYNLMNGNNTKRLSPAPVHDNKNNEETIRTTISITKHVCANCGRLRSGKYHHENPIKVGEAVTPAFCRKCQKDASSASSSPSNKDPKKNEFKGKKSSKTPNKGARQDVSSITQGSREQLMPRHKIKRREVEDLSTEEYSTVDEECFEQGLRTGRARLRIEESEIERRPLSPIVGYSVRGRSLTPGIPKDYKIPTRRYPRQRTVQQRVRERSPSPFSQHIPATARSLHAAQPERLYRRQLPVHRFVEDFNEPCFPSQVPRNSGGVVPERSIANRENSFDTISSNRSQEGRYRRRRERATPDTRPWEEPHIIYPRTGYETVVVTERYIYKPKTSPHMEEELEEQRRQREFEKAALDSRSRTTGSSAEEEASKYYRNDWARDEQYQPGREPVAKRGARGRYRRNSYQGSEITDSESIEFVRIHASTPQTPPPRAPTPPSQTRASRAGNQLDLSPCSLRPNDVTVQWLNDTQKMKAPGRNSAIELPNSGSLSISKHRPQLLQKVADGELTTALIQSPRLFSARGSLHNECSDVFKREQLAESATRHVTFREPGSPRSVKNVGWTEPERTDRTASEGVNWDEGGVSQW